MAQHFPFFEFPFPLQRTKIEKLVRLIPPPLTPYKVILYKDTVHVAHEVIQALLQSVPVSTQEAHVITIKAHIDGQAVIIICNREEAEYYQERLETYGLAIGIEPL